MVKNSILKKIYKIALPVAVAGALAMPAKSRAIPFNLNNNDGFEVKTYYGMSATWYLIHNATESTIDELVFDLSPIPDDLMDYIKILPPTGWKLSEVEDSKYHFESTSPVFNLGSQGYKIAGIGYNIWVHDSPFYHVNLRKSANRLESELEAEGVYGKEYEDEFGIYDLRPYSSNPSPVPEPATLPMVGSGLLMLAYLNESVRKKTKSLVDKLKDVF